MNSCYALTLLAIAEFSKVSIVSLSSTARGKVEKVHGGGYQITEIVVKPRVVLASANDLARMPRILEKAKENCFISNSIKSVITVEPEVFHHQVPASPCPLGGSRLLPLLVGTKTARGYRAHVLIGSFRLFLTYAKRTCSFRASEKIRESSLSTNRSLIGR